MGRIIGIDLGTTYSAVAIPEERTGDGFMNVRDCPGYSIVIDPWKNRITPSVVAEDEQGKIVVGHRAKGRAGLSPEPIMFAKRYMGEDTTFQLAKQGALQPEDVSAHILRYLKQMAEERLGEPVDEAVITVPAYFSLRARQMTEKAGEMAGLRVAQIAQEPVAAALMYCASDPRDPLRVMTYDLGGGTFDIAILEKRDGTISTNSILAFDGDRFLGGYDFDKTLALWLMDQLNDRNYDLRLNLENPSDKVIFAKLMVYAERAKIALSRNESYGFQEPSTGIIDHAGNPVSIDLTITRDEFEAMIRKQVEYTIELCHRARLEKANPPIGKDQFDEILMIGGSSRIPLIARRLEEEFGQAPRLVEPDLCVALGAAIIAGTIGTSLGCLKLDPLPTETDLPSLVVAGRVAPSEDLTVVQGCKVTLRALDESYQNSRMTGAEGAFVFDQVELASEATTDFILSVTSPAGVEVAAHRFSVRQTEKAGDIRGDIHIPNVLSKPIGILIVDEGRMMVHKVVPERTPLPYETVVNAKIMDTSGEIRVPIVEENNPLGEIVMKGLPQTLAVGSAVHVTLTIQENYQIRGRAHVPAVGREAKVVIEIPVPPKKSLDELRRNYDELAKQADDVLAGASSGVLFGDAKAKRLKDRLKETGETFNGRGAEPTVIQDRLDEIESLVREIGAGWRPEPPRAVFDQKASEADQLLAEAIKQNPKAQQDGYDKQLAAIRSEAEQAYTAQNTAAWKDSFNKVVKLCDDLERLTRKGGDGLPPDPFLILRALAQEIAALEQWSKDNGRYEKFKAEFQELADELKRLNPKADDFTSQIRDWYLTKFEDLRKRLEAPETTSLVGLDVAKR